MSHSPHMTLAAEYFTVGKINVLDLVWIDSQTGSRHVIARNIRVSGKREARKVAQAHGATPWNF